ncbi:hypothetical protein OOK06_27930 [Streptomyces sp. NBC_00340]|nr:hypothetical protein [Streptomyces sp. NBC_00340]
MRRLVVVGWVVGVGEVAFEGVDAQGADEEGEGVAEEGQGVGEGEEDAADGGSGELFAVDLCCGDAAVGADECLVAGDDDGQDGLGGDVEEDVSAAQGESGGDEEGDVGVVGQDGQGEQGQDGEADEVGAEHDLSAVPAVDEGAGG